MADRAASTARKLGLPFDVLIGRDSRILTDYRIIKLPRVLMIGKKGSIVFTERFASYETLKREIQRTIKKNL